MNRYPLWICLLIATVLLVGVLYALPNLFGEDPALQISSTRGAKVDAGTEARIKGMLQEAGIATRCDELSPGSLLVRFANTEGQLKAQDLVKRELGDDYIVALNLAPTTPAWLRAIKAQPMYLGLDLRGGVHFLMQVDMAPVLQVTERDSADGPLLVAQLTEAQQRETQRFAVQQNITTLRNRVNELGVAEPVIQQQGLDRIVVQLPGVQDTARAKEILGATATLEFRMVSEKGNVADAVAGRVPLDSRLYRTRTGQPVLLQKRVIITGESITDAASTIDQRDGSPAVSITLDGTGARAMQNTTQENVGKLMAVVFIENKTETRYENGQAVKTKKRVEEVINRATIREPFSKRFQITGLDNPDEARTLALLLRAGALSAPIDIVEERTVGPSLGQENIDKGFMSCLIGLAAITLFMSVYYRVFGVIASVSLFLNLVLMVAVLSMMQATLTLPGIAGIALTIGMAIDANVLIFERVREELRNGNTPQAAIHAGYERAWGTILDSNITTLIAGIAQFLLGSGPIRGFAVVLCIGILTSMFSAVLVSRAMVNLLYGQRKVSSLAI